MTHQESIELLPWYVNGTLKPQERARLESHLKDCVECQRELQRTQSLSAAVVETAERVPEPPPFLFTRAAARVEEYEREKAGRRWWFARAVMVAQFALILSLGAVLLNRERVFTTASGTSRGSIMVVFQDGVSEQTLRRVVLDMRGSIVSGPSALGLYSIQVPRSEDVDKLLENLRQNHGVIRFAARQR